jgi:hypothetical protein
MSRRLPKPLVGGSSPPGTAHHFNYLGRGTQWLNALSRAWGNRPGTGCASEGGWPPAWHPFGSPRAISPRRVASAPGTTRLLADALSPSRGPSRPTQEGEGLVHDLAGQCSSHVSIRAKIANGTDT